MAINMDIVMATIITVTNQNLKSAVWAPAAWFFVSVFSIEMSTLLQMNGLMYDVWW